VTSTPDLPTPSTRERLRQARLPQNLLKMGSLLALGRNAPIGGYDGQDPVDEVPLQALRVVEPGQGRRVELVASLT